MHVLSCFIDESGDFGPYEVHNQYYFVSIVFHDQAIDISPNLHAFDRHLSNIGYKDHVIHTGPVIRREEEYRYDLMERRKELFDALYNFARKAPFKYTSICINKKECNDALDQAAKLSRAISNALKTHIEYLLGFDKLIIYYDNGQLELTRIINAVFNTLFHNVELRKVSPNDYKLFQVADLICTLELIKVKSENSTLSRSEQEFFSSRKLFNKNYYRKIADKRWI